MELSWQQFRQLNRIAKLPLNEQTKEYSYYLDTLANQRIQQNKGPKAVQTPPTPPLSEFLLQENSSYLLLEDGFKIYL